MRRDSRYLSFLKMTGEKGAVLSFLCAFYVLLSWSQNSQWVGKCVICCGGCRRGAEFCYVSFYLYLEFERPGDSCFMYFRSR